MTLVKKFERNPEKKPELPFGKFEFVFTYIQTLSERKVIDIVHVMLRLKKTPATVIFNLVDKRSGSKSGF